MDYKELDAWKECRKLAAGIYKISANFNKDEKYGITNQLRRAVVSVPSNIAEGNGRQYKKETIQFLYIAKGSLYEVETQIYIAFDLKMISKTVLDNILQQILKCMKLLQGLIRYYEGGKGLK